MGQHEYSVPLSPVKPHEMEQLAKNYLSQKEKEERERQENESRSRASA
jgi:hypothetical protein